MLADRRDDAAVTFPRGHELAERVAELQPAAGREQQRIPSVQYGQDSLAVSADDEHPVADAHSRG